MYKFNINDFVKVKLTERGKDIYKHRYDKMFENYPHLKETLGNAPELKIDKDGYSKFQLHDFMNCFGPYIFNGAPLVIENNEIYFESGLVAVKPVLGELRKPFGATEKILKDIEKEEIDKTKNQDKSITEVNIPWDVMDIMEHEFDMGIRDLVHLIKKRRLTVDYYRYDNNKSFEVYYLDDKPIIEVTIEKRYNELHGYGYLSLTEEETRTTKIL